MNIVEFVVFLALSLCGMAMRPALVPTCSAGDEVASFLQSRLEVNTESELSYGELSGEPKVPTHTCFGDSGYQSCLFRNLCLDTQKPSQRTLFYFSNGPMPFENMTLNTRPPLSAKGWPPRVSYDARMDVTIQAVPGAMPEDAAISPDNATVLIQTLYEFNFGHLVDSLFGAYRMQRVFNIPFNARIITSTAAPPWQAFVSKVFSMITRDEQKVGSQSLDSLFVSRLLQTSRNEKPNARYLCFPNMVVGSGPFTFTNPNERSSAEWWRFRGLIIGNFGRGNVRHDVTISQKSPQNRFGMAMGAGNVQTALAGRAQAIYKHYVGRIAMLQRNLQKAFPGTSVNVVDYAKLPMKDQILMTSNLKALITAPGGGSFVALFLPTGASLIITVEHDLGDDLLDDAFENEYLLWKSFQWLSFLKVSDMLSNEVDGEVSKALDRPTGSAPDVALE